jgi:hypothetical protein
VGSLLRKSAYQQGEIGGLDAFPSLGKSNQNGAQSMQEGRIATLELGRIFLFLNRILFREIQESVGFPRNPQDFKNSCRKTKKCSCF